MILVDLPGLDQEKEYMEVLQKCPSCTLAAFFSPILVGRPSLNEPAEKRVPAFLCDVGTRYMADHPCENVLLVYVLDVNSKINNADRDFFVELMKSPWGLQCQARLVQARVMFACSQHMAFHPWPYEAVRKYFHFFPKQRAVGVLD